MRLNGLYKLELSQRVAAAIGDSPFKIGAKADDEGVELLVHGFIGDPWEGLDSLSVAQFLQDHQGKPVTVRVNSDGGFVFDGLAIANALAQHEGATTGIVEGIAASAATIILTGADTIKMHETSTYMIHRAIGLAFGNRDTMADEVDILDLIDSQIAAVYTNRTGLDRDTVAEMMVGKADGTWMGAEKAKELGFVDEIIPAKGAKEPKEKNQANAKPDPLAWTEKQAIELRRRVVDVTSIPS